MPLASRTHGQHGHTYASGTRQRSRTPVRHAYFNTVAGSAARASGGTWWLPRHPHRPPLPPRQQPTADSRQSTVDKQRRPDFAVPRQFLTATTAAVVAISAPPSPPPPLIHPPARASRNIAPSHLGHSGSSVAVQQTPQSAVRLRDPRPPPLSPATQMLPPALTKRLALYYLFQVPSLLRTLS
jgi:hypothetical protein